MQTVIMAKKKDKSTKKEIRREVMEKMSTALEIYRNELGDKKFNSRIKKASRVFSENLGKKKKSQSRSRIIERPLFPETLTM